MDRKLTCDESEDLEKDLTINEIKKIIFSMKQYKSPGSDGIINEFYQIYWDTIKEDLFEVLLEMFDKFEICDSQCRGMLTLLHKGGDRDNIRNWRPITLLNSDYKNHIKTFSKSHEASIKQNYSYGSKRICSREKYKRK